MAYSAKRKYCQAMEKFVRIRVMSSEQITSMFRSSNIKDKESYKSLLVSYCVINYFDNILPLITEENRKTIENDLLRICIELNPSLDINKVVLPDKDEEDHFALINAETETTQKISFEDTENNLRKFIIGQDQAIGLVINAIKRKTILREENSLIGNFLFAGQTGVGKTEFARVLAKSMFGTEEHLIRIDCSEYAASHEYSKLIGAPPGYIGHNDGGQLTEKQKKLKKSVLLFDEIEKAHEKLFNVLLGLMDYASLTDGKGEKVLFNETVLIMTSNVGVRDVIHAEKGYGFTVGNEMNTETRKKETMKQIEGKFSPEFINRLDSIVVFNNLGRTEMRKIVLTILLNTKLKLSCHGMKLQITRQAVEFLIDNGSDPKYGARPLKRAVQKYVEDIISDAIINKIFKINDTILVSLRSDKMALEVTATSDNPD